MEKILVKAKIECLGYSCLGMSNGPCQPPMPQHSPLHLAGRHGPARPTRKTAWHDTARHGPGWSGLGRASVPSVPLFFLIFFQY